MGLSYTTFRYGALSLPSGPINAGDSLHATVTVTNTGSLEGDEVVQLYLKFPDVAGAPNVALCGFQRVRLAPGSSRNIEFTLDARALSMVTEAGDIVVPEGTYTVSVGGGQPKTEAASVSGVFTVRGRATLPE